ncbi:MAG: aldo/keto reductase, partial [bacterium]|nr:aldo/keto reductase [bacterium]
MKHQTLGRTNLRVSQLGYGSMGLRGPNTWGVRVVSDDDADRFLNSVLDAGINFIDTSPDYGASEERIGRAISHRRSEFVLATKCGCDPVQHADHLEIKHTWNRETIERNIEQSLQRLQTDVIDLLQFHGGDAETLQKEGLIDLAMRFREQGV